MENARLHQPRFASLSLSQGQGRRLRLGQLFAFPRENVCFGRERFGRAALRLRAAGRIFDQPEKVLGSGRPNGHSHGLGDTVSREFNRHHGIRSVGIHHPTELRRRIAPSASAFRGLQGARDHPRRLDQGLRDRRPSPARFGRSRPGRRGGLLRSAQQLSTARDKQTVSHHSRRGTRRHAERGS